MALELVTTDGLFRLDGFELEVTNNIWLLGDDREVLVFDASHDHQPIVSAAAGRRVEAVVLSHGHSDHINRAAALREAVDAPILLHPADRMLWDRVYGADADWDRDLEDGAVLEAAGHRLRVIHTPGHSPGSCCFHDAASGRLISGDTLFKGGPGATGPRFTYSDEPTILRSIRDFLLTLPGETVVHTGHGESTTIEDETRTVLDRLAELGIDRSGG